MESHYPRTDAAGMPLIRGGPSGPPAGHQVTSTATRPQRRAGAPAAFAISAFDVRESTLRRSGSIGSRRRDLA